MPVSRYDMEKFIVEVWEAGKGEGRPREKERDREIDIDSKKEQECKRVRE